MWIAKKLTNSQCRSPNRKWMNSNQLCLQNHELSDGKTLQLLPKAAILYLAQQKRCQHLLSLKLKLLKHVRNLFYYSLLSYPSKLSQQLHYCQSTTKTWRNLYGNIHTQYMTMYILNWKTTPFFHTHCFETFIRMFDFDTYITDVEKGILISCNQHFYLKHKSYLLNTYS